MGELQETLHNMTKTNPALTDKEKTKKNWALDLEIYIHTQIQILHI